MRLVLHAPGLFRPGGIHGAAVTLTVLARSLAAAGHAVTLLLDADDAAPRDLPGTVLPATDLAQTLRDAGAQAAVVAIAPEAAAALAACRALGLPTALYVPTVTLSSHDAALDIPDVLHLVDSPFAAARLRAWCGGAAAVLPPIVPPPTEDGGPHDRVLFVNPVPEKGWEIALAVMEALRSVPFIVLEAWPLTAAWRDWCLSRVARLGNVDWRGTTTDMEPVWRRVRTLLMPSIAEETWGRVAGEAVARGIPVVASTRGALPDTVGAGGRLCDIHGPLDPWIAAVARLAGDAAHHAQLAAAARAHAARTQPPPAAVARMLVDLLAARAAA